MPIEFGNNWPTCGKCNVRVAQLAGSFNPLTGCYSFVAACHGEQQFVTLTAYEMLNVKTISMTTAFAVADG
jgi:hypothetical protein